MLSKHKHERNYVEQKPCLLFFDRQAGKEQKVCHMCSIIKPLASVN